MPIPSWVAHRSPGYRWFFGRTDRGSRRDQHRSQSFTGQMSQRRSPLRLLPIQPQRRPPLAPAAGHPRGDPAAPGRSAQLRRMAAQHRPSATHAAVLVARPGPIGRAHTRTRPAEPAARAPELALRGQGALEDRHRNRHRRLGIRDLVVVVKTGGAVDLEDRPSPSRSAREGSAVIRSTPARRRLIVPLAIGR